MGSPHMVIAILGGLGLFLLGMAVMTDGLRALAGSALRNVLARAAATPAKGTFWGAAVTLIVQSSSATTMTTIGLVSAGLLSFPQALGVVFGANLGTTGTGWLVALLGVKFSLNATAMPMLFAGSLLRLMGRGRWAGTGGAIAGFALLLVGLTVLQGGMAGLATRINPADLPAVAASGAWGAVLGVLLLVLAGVVMTTAMQSSSAAVAATLSALHAGAIGPDQAAALVIGQNIGSAVSSAIAAIGAATPAKRTAVAHVLFNVVTAAVALAAFPLYAPHLKTWAAAIDATTLLAAFHTAYNVIGVAMLLPLVGPFARFVERVVPQRGPVLTRFLDRSVLTVPAIGLEAARRTVACTLQALCERTAVAVEQRGTLQGGLGGAGRDRDTLHEVSDALTEVRTFLSALALPAESVDSQQRISSTLHALDHTGRFAEAAEQALANGMAPTAPSDPEATRAAGLCAQALRLSAMLAARLSEPSGSPAPGAMPPDQSLEVVNDLARRSAELADLRRAHRRATLSIAATFGGGAVAADQAIARVDAVRHLDRLAYHAWRAVAHLTVGADHKEIQASADRTPEG